MKRRLFLGLLPLLLSSIVVISAGPVDAQEADPATPGAETFEVTVIDFAYEDAERGLVNTIWTVEADDGTDLAISTLGGVRSDGITLGVSHEPHFEVGTTYEVELVPVETAEGAAEAVEGPQRYRLPDGEFSVIQAGSAEAGGVAEANPTNFTLLGWDWNSTLDSAGSVGFSINPNTNDVTNEIAIIQRSMDRWENDPESDMNWTYNGTTSINQVNRDGVNAVFWNTSPEFTSTTNVLARAYYWSSGGNGLETDIVFNDYKAWVDGTASGSFDIESVGTHEAGHGLGLGHAPLLPAVMYASFSSNSLRRALSLGDQGGVRALYPDPTGGTFTSETFSTEFSSSNPSGKWSYLWNQNGAIGGGNYTPLLWNTFHFDSDGQVGGATNDDFSYGLIAGWGVHTGLGAGQGGSVLDRFAIIRFTVATTGPYSITSSSIADIGCASSGAEVRVLLNNSLMNSKTINGSGDFNTNFGNLSAGDTIDVAVGPGVDNVCDAYDVDFTVTGSSGPVEPPTVGDESFSSEYSSSNPSGKWSYLWNQNGAIGSGNYTPLLWNTFHFDSDGQVGGATNDDFSYGLVAGWGVHTGLGAGQGGSVLDRFAIIRYAVAATGPYSITSSSIADIGCASSGAEVQVLVNNVTRSAQSINGSGSFDTNFGTLNAGDTIDVAVGPGINNVCDAYSLDFTVSPSSGPVEPPTVIVGTFSENVNAGSAAAGWTFWWNQNGAAPGTGYTQLAWNGTSYTSGGAATLPTADEFAYGRVAPWGAHPGRGAGQGAAADRDAIIRYTVSTSGAFAITNSSIVDGSCPGSVQVLVAVNNATVLTAGPVGSFDTTLGSLVAGDTIDVLVSPDGFDTCDSTELDYTITRTG